MTADAMPARSRRESRERAVELGYEAEMRGWTVDELLDSLTLPPDPFSVDLLRWAEAERERAEQLIEARSIRWPLARMAVLDRVIMRQAVAELLSGTTPSGVVLSQAVELAGRYSTDGSGRFVNGILAAVADGLAGESAEESHSESADRPAGASADRPAGESDSGSAGESDSGSAGESAEESDSASDSAPA